MGIAFFSKEIQCMGRQSFECHTPASVCTMILRSAIASIIPKGCFGWHVSKGVASVIPPSYGR